MTMRICNILLACLLLASVHGCTMAPKYVRPDAPIPNTYSGEVEKDEANRAWKDFFQDEGIQRVIETTLANNRDLRLAMLHIERTRAAYRIQGSELLPTISAGGSGSNQYLPADLAPRGERTHVYNYTANLGFSGFELDLFGRIRSLTKQAVELFHSAQEDANTARLSLVAESAALYLQLVADREQYDLAKATAENRRKNYELMQQRFANGIISDLALSQAKMLMDEADINLSQVTTQLGQDENLLVLIMGAPLPADMPNVRRLAEVKQLPDVPAGLPSSLLERRPDIRSAEHVLKGANANIGAARANFFPTIRLTGDVGRMTTDLYSLGKSSQHAWSFMGQLSLPIFDTGRNIALLDLSKAERDMAVASYEQSIQTAFREVADALVQRDNIGTLLAAQESLTASSARAHGHAQARYTAGVADYLAVLDAERTLYGAQSGLIAARLLREANALTLYKSLGGGWE